MLRLNFFEGVSCKLILNGFLRICINFGLSGRPVSAKA
ncbi:hypothetical protein Z945_33 [Sulfitobacter noctilucae]|nr:hypothetical protein Z945_33 [Sulfitobacter noctilucae]